MLKKILLSAIAAILLTVSVSGTAFAAEGDQTPLVKVRGEVIVVDSDAGKFRIETPDGSVQTFFVNEETKYRGLESLDEMQEGWKAGVAAREDEEGKLQAVLVIAGEIADFQQARGKITDVNSAGGKFSIQTSSGEELRFFVDQNTRYGGQASGLDDLEVGMGAGVIYQELSAGKWTALGLVAGYAPDLLKVRGEVTAVDSQLGKFEIETPDGSRSRFFVDENTRYQGQLSSLDEMQPGWVAGVAAREDEDGSFTAVLVIAGERPETISVQGEIVAIDVQAGKFRIETSAGDVKTFFVNENTSYRGQVSGIGDLEVGLRAGVAGFEDQDGKMIARVVVAGSPPDQRPEIIKAQGKIKTVNPGAGKFQLEKSDGSALTIYVDGNTNYRGQVSSFAELEKDMRAVMVGYMDGEGRIIARLIAAGTPRRERQGGDQPNPGRELPREALPPTITS